MASRNKVEIIGRLGQDPEIRTINNGTKVANISVATSERWKDKQTGEQREATEWHRVVLWDRLAELAEQYLFKGSEVLLVGKLVTRKWQDQQGQDRYTTEIVLQGPRAEMQFLGKPADGQQGSQQGGGQQSRPQQQGPGGWGSPQQPTHSGGGQQKQAPGNEPPMDFDDDIPF